MPVRVFADGNRADRKAQLAKVVADIAPARSASRHRHGRERRRRQRRGQAGARPRPLSHHRDLLWQRTGARDQTSLDPQCLSGFRKNEKYEIEHSDVILTVDNGDFIFLDCAYEELLQSLGPINDTTSVPWTMFNDNVSMGFFDVYDQYILNILYDPRIKAGMTVAEVKAVLPRGAGRRAGVGERRSMIWRSES